MDVLLKKIQKKLREFKRDYTHIRFYKEPQPVIYLHLAQRTKARTYLNLFFRIRGQYKEPIVIQFSFVRMFILAKWFKELDYIYFKRPFSNIIKLKTFSHQSSADFRVNYQYRKIAGCDEYIKDALPYIMHPVNYLQPNTEKLQKKIGILMSGNFDKKIYNTRLISECFGLRNRWEIYTEIIRHRKSSMLSANELFKDLADGGFKKKLVVLQWQMGAIPTEKWRQFLSTADFLFCVPGMTMPLCHHVLEAMSMGVIPILNYPNWLNPSLKEDIHCLVFQELSDINQMIEKALSLSEEKKLEMSNNVQRYYKTYYENYTFPLDGNHELIVLNENLSDLRKEK